MKNISIIGLLGPIIGVLGVVGPIGWDYYKTKSEIELRSFETNIVISKPEKLDGLVITYSGEPLEELSKTVFILTNSGRTPILKTDVVAPITVAFSKKSQIIGAKLEKLQPNDLGAVLQFNKTAQSIIVDFPLLNPGDKVEFSVLAKTADITFNANGRIAGVSSLHVVKDFVEGKSNKRSWTIYPVGIFSAFLGLASIIGFVYFPAEQRIKSQVRSGTFNLPTFKTLDEWVDWVNSIFYFTTDKERAPLLALLRKMPLDEILTQEQEEEITVMIRKVIENATPNLLMAIGSLLFAVAGGWYVISTI